MSASLDIAPQLAQIRGALGAGSTDIYAVKGPANSGRSELLVQLAADPPSNRTAALIAPAASSYDSAAEALSQLAAAIILHEGDDPDALRLEDVIGKGAWHEKFEKVAHHLRRCGDGLLLLVDDALSSAPDAPTMAERLTEVRELVITAPCPRVVVSDHRLGGHDPVELHAARVRRPWICSDEWGALREVVDVVAARDRNPETTPLAFRLAVLEEAVDAGHRTSVADVPTSSAAVWEIVSRPGDNARRRFVREAWTKLALLRQPVDVLFVQQLVGPAPTEFDADLVRLCLLLQDARELLRMDADLSHVAQQHHVDSPAVHSEIALLYTGRVAGLMEDDERPIDAEHLADGFEAYHHATMGDTDLVKRLRPFFAEQYSARGARHSLLREYAEARECFELALSWDERDDYSHHYYAYNHDVEGLDPETVRRHYVAATRIRSGHHWWWSRLICFQLDRGDVGGAEASWHAAESALGLRVARPPQRIVDELHVDVATSALWRGAARLAKRVLDNVPPGMRPARRDALHNWLGHMQAARADQVAFPLSVEWSKRWSGPHLFHASAASGSRWFAGRVDAADASSVSLSGAFSDAPGAFVDFEVPTDMFTGWWNEPGIDQTEIDEGRFIELVWLEDDGDPLMRVHPAEDIDGRITLVPYFDPDRYDRT